MAIEWTGTLTLGAIATFTLTLPFTIRLVWLKIFSPTVTAKNGDARSAQTGPINGGIGIANSGEGAKFHLDAGLTIINPPQPKYSETERRSAKKEIRKAFEKYFYSFLGKEGMEGNIGGIFAKQHLDPTQPKTFKKGFAPQVREIVYGCKNRLEVALVTPAKFLEDPSAEKKIDELRQRLVDTADRDVFEITEELRTATYVEIDTILGLGTA